RRSRRAGERRSSRWSSCLSLCAHAAAAASADGTGRRAEDYGHRDRRCGRLRVEMTTIVLADDHAVVRSGLRLLLDRAEGFEVIAEAGDAEGAVRSTLGH